MSSFTDFHLRDFVYEVRRDPSRPSYESALQLHLDINIPGVQGEERSDDVEVRPIPALVRYFAPAGQIDLYREGVFIYARGSFTITSTQDVVPQLVATAYSADW